MSQLPRIESLDVANKTIFLRVDWNVPLSKSNGNIKVSDNTRIEKTVPTIHLLLSRGAKLVLATHVGRPGGKVDPALSTKHLLSEAQKTLNKELIHCPEVQGKKFESMVKNLQSGELLLIENVRFEAGEKKNDDALAKAWAKNCDFFINDAFGTAHRAHASNNAIAQHLPSYAGILLQKEVDALGKLLQNPQHPFVAVIGGAKISTKIGVLKNLLNLVDIILIGGAMAYTFLKSRAVPIGNSMFEQDELVNSFQILEKAELEKCEIILPSDHLIASEFSESAKSKIVGKMDIPDGYLGMDIGPKTIDQFEKIIRSAKTVFWNGPMGVFEFDKYSKGTLAIARAIAKSKSVSVVGGGDSVAALELSGVADKIDHVSTGGGASLEFMEGKRLPGISAILKEDES
jgi:phosphoglycerate kinase